MLWAYNLEEGPAVWLRCSCTVLLGGPAHPPSHCSRGLLTKASPRPPTLVFCHYLTLICCRGLLAKDPVAWIDSLQAKGLLAEGAAFLDPWAALCGFGEIRRYMQQVGAVPPKWRLCSLHGCLCSLRGSWLCRAHKPRAGAGWVLDS